MLFANKCRYFILDTTTLAMTNIKYLTSHRLMGAASGLVFCGEGPDFQMVHGYFFAVSEKAHQNKVDI